MENNELDINRAELFRRADWLDAQCEKKLDAAAEAFSLMDFDYFDELGKRANEFSAKARVLRQEAREL